MTNVFPPSVILKAAALVDVPALARIHVAASTNDPAVQIRLPDPESHAEKVSKMLAEQIPDPPRLVMKAVEPKTGSIRGRASWLGMNYE